MMRDNLNMKKLNDFYLCINRLLQAIFQYLQTELKP